MLVEMNKKQAGKQKCTPSVHQAYIRFCYNILLKLQIICLQFKEAQSGDFHKALYGVKNLLCTKHLNKIKFIYSTLLGIETENIELETKKCGSLYDITQCTSNTLVLCVC